MQWQEELNKIGLNKVEESRDKQTQMKQVRIWTKLELGRDRQRLVEIRRDMQSEVEASRDTQRQVETSRDKQKK